MQPPRGNGLLVISPNVPAAMVERRQGWTLRDYILRQELYAGYAAKVFAVSIA